VHAVTEEEPLAMQIVGAAEIDELLEHGLASLLSRAYTDQRHLDSYSIAELSRWSDGLSAMGADPVAAMPREWLTRFPTMRNLWRPAESRIGSVHFLERVDGRVIGHVALFEHEFQLGNEAGVRAGYIEDVATSPSALGTGVASTLMQAAAAHATDTGYEVMGLSTGIPKFYARLGWVVWRGIATYVARNGDALPNEGTMVLGLTKTGRELLDRTQGGPLRGGLRDGE
jgi:GNAT superfamily N-acetyltransferase